MDINRIVHRAIVGLFLLGCISCGRAVRTVPRSQGVHVFASFNSYNVRFEKQHNDSSFFQIIPLFKGDDGVSLIGVKVDRPRQTKSGVKYKKVLEYGIVALERGFSEILLPDDELVQEYIFAVREFDQPGGAPVSTWKVLTHSPTTLREQVGVVIPPIDELPSLLKTMPELGDVIRNGKVSRFFDRFDELSDAKE